MKSGRLHESVPGTDSGCSPVNVGLDQKSMTIEITQYGSRHWAVLIDGRLLCVTVYKKGALAVRDALLNGGAKAGQVQESAPTSSASISGM
jgi:hypothetical protein